MAYLLDTHTFLWFVEGSSQLSSEARTRIENLSQEKFVSIASFWEIAIKLNIGKLNLAVSIQELYEEVGKNGFNILPITINHIEKTRHLDSHQRDPFDRLLISQAMVDSLTLISKDMIFSKYPVNHVW